MSIFKKKSIWLLSAIALTTMGIVVLLLFLLGSLLVLKEWLPTEGMNYFVKITVFLSVFVSGKTIYRVKNGEALLCYAISALLSCGCIALVALAMGEGSGNPLKLLENFAIGILAALFGAFVQIRHNNRRKKRRRIR